MRTVLDPKPVTGTVLRQFDFSSLLQTGETLASAVVTASVYSGTDPTPSAIISGSATVSGGVVSQNITAGVLGCIYELLCVATTSVPHSIPMAAFLAIVPDLV